MKVLCTWLLFCATSITAISQTGPFSPAAGLLGSTAIHKDSNIIYGWVSGCVLERGRQDIANSSGPYVSVGDETMVAGKADGTVVSLGDGGVAVIELDIPISNHQGYDFAVFENGFYNAAGGGYFLELAFVEVSSDGSNYFRLPNQSFTPTNVQVGSFGSIDPTQIDGLAGKYISGYGTPFDLQQLENVTGLDIYHITHIRIVDVVGSIDTSFATFDNNGNIVNDPYPTDFASGGFDLDAVALINASLVTGLEDMDRISVSVYPNPATDRVYIAGVDAGSEVSIFNLNGSLVKSVRLYNFLSVSELPLGIYYLLIETDFGMERIKFIKM